MSLSCVDQGSEESDEVPKKPVLAYSREFLLPFSSFDICKKLPSGFDESILSEFEDPLPTATDRPKIPGSLALQGYRKNDYGSSPPTGEDSNNYSRGIHGRWDSCSSGRSDRDGDSQVERESGRRYVHPFRRSWQTPEHDGILGSGSFPRTSGYATGVSASKVQTDDQYQLSKSYEPYHPPRPYKEVAHSRMDIDAYNDETFGSCETASEDKVDEERRRRASFELLRKEQQKALQEKQKLNLKEQKIGGMSELLENDKDEKELFARSNESEVSSTSVLNNDSELPSSALHSTAPRSLVPPGLCGNTEDKNSELKTLILHSSSEVAKPVRETSLMDVVVNLLQNGSTDVDIVGQPPETAQHTTLSNKLDKKQSHETLGVPIKKFNLKQQLSTSHFESYGNLKDFKITEVLDDRTVVDSKGSDSTSILEKNFGGKLSTELDYGKPDVMGSPALSSKFARLFLEKEDKAAADNNIPSTKPNDLLSSIVTGDRANGNSGLILINGFKEKLVPTVLTFEDFEQSILSGFDADGRNIQPLNSWSSHGAVTDQPGRVDNHVSLHLPSMWQNSTKNNTSLKSGDDVNMTATFPVYQKHDTNPTVQGNIHSSSPNLRTPPTLETLLGTALMKELQLVGAPLSSQRGPIGVAQGDALEPHGLPHQFPDNENSSRIINGIHRSGLDNSIIDYGNLTKQSEAENWLRFNDPQIKMWSSGHNPEAASKHDGLETMYLHLPKDDMLFEADAPNHQIPTFMASGNGFNFSSNAPPTYRTNITDKWDALGGGVSDEVARAGSEVRRSSFNNLDRQIPHQNVPVQQSVSPQFRPQQANQAWRPFHHIESDSTHMDMGSPAEFPRQDSIFSHYPPSDHQFPPTWIRPPFHHLNPGFDAPPRQPMMHQMQIPRRYPPRMQRNHMQGHHFGPPRTQNIGGRRLPGPGGNPHKAFERLIEMRLQENPN